MINSYLKSIESILDKLPFYYMSLHDLIVKFFNIYIYIVSVIVKKML